MRREVLIQLHANFEEIVEIESGVEYGFARDLQKVLGYARRENFAKVVEKAAEACENSGYDVLDHFRDVTKMVPLGTGS